MQERKWVCIPRKVLAHIPDLNPLQQKVVWYIIMRTYGYWSPKEGRPIPWLNINVSEMSEEMETSRTEIRKTLCALVQKKVVMGRKAVKREIGNENSDYIIDARAENWT